MNLTCKRGSVGQSEGLSIPRSSVRFRLKPDTSNSHEFELHRPSHKGTKLLFKTIKASIIINEHTNSFLWHKQQGERDITSVSETAVQTYFCPVQQVCLAWQLRLAWFYFDPLGTFASLAGLHRLISCPTTISSHNHHSITVRKFSRPGS